jgi:hypothetical protein
MIRFTKQLLKRSLQPSFHGKTGLAAPGLTVEELKQALPFGDLFRGMSFGSSVNNSWYDGLKK